MKQVIFLLAIIFTFNAYGKEVKDTTIKGHSGRFQIGINISPDYSFRTLKNDGSEIGVQVADVYNQIEKPKLGYTISFNIKYKLTKAFALETGLQYADKGYQTTWSNLILSDGLYGVVHTPDGSEGKAVYDYYYLGVPLKIDFTAGSRKLRFIASAGLVIDFLKKISNPAVLKYANGETDNIFAADTRASYNSIIISPEVSAGVSYKISNRIVLNAGPIFRYGISNVTESKVTHSLWSAGFNVGCYFSL